MALHTLTGPAIAPHLPALAALRITIFRDWPYIYDGDPAYEAAYVQSYVRSPRAAVIAAFAGDAVIGAATCLPLADETGNITTPFTKAGLDPATWCYFGESVLLSPYRGTGIGVAFFDARLAHARQCGFTHAAFCAVQRPADHPSRPPDARPLDTFWRHRGFTKHPSLQCEMSWRDVGAAEETAKTMIFWTRTL